MRYSKELQKTVHYDIVHSGKSIIEIAQKYNIPKELALKWGNIDFDVENAKEVVVKKYMRSINEAECNITNELAKIVSVDSITDDEWDELCNSVSRQLMKTASEIVQEERYSMCDFAVPSVIAEVEKISSRWQNCDFKKYIETGKDFEKKIQKLSDSSKEK